MMAEHTPKQIKIEKLLDHGVNLLTQKGYHGVGLKEILDTVKIPKGSFYNYFNSKEHFAVEVIGHYIAPFIQQLSTHLQNPELDALTAIKFYFNELISELENNGFDGGCLLGNLMGELGESKGVVREALQKAVHEYRDLLQSGLTQAQQEGTVRIDKSASEMADLLVNTWQGVLLRMKIEQSSQPLKQCCQHLLDDHFRV